MEAFDYFETAQDALETLTEMGKPASVTVAQRGEPDPATGEAPALAPLVTTAYAVIFGYSARAYGNQPDARIRAGDRNMFMAAIDQAGAPIPPEALAIDADVLGPDGDVYTLKNVEPIGPTGVIALYDCNVRRPG